MNHLPPIHKAALNGVLEEVLRLIYQDPQLVNSTSRYGYTPLMYASERGHVSVVAALVDHGANLDHQNGGNWSALWLACSYGHAAVVALLIEKGAHPIPSTAYRHSPLMIASLRGRVAVVHCLLQHPSVLSTIDHHGPYGFMALHDACSEGHHKVVKMLLEAGADPMQRTTDGRTTMDIAIHRRHPDYVILLEWDRYYTITKARRLHDAFYRHQQGIAIAIAIAAASASSSSDGGHATSKRPRVEAVIPIYLKGRVEGGQPLPKVEMVDGNEEGSLVESVLEYVICGGLKGELFAELMEMLGKTGYREEEEAS